MGVAWLAREGLCSPSCGDAPRSVPSVASGSAQGSLEQGGFHESISPWGQHSHFGSSSS